MASCIIYLVRSYMGYCPFILLTEHERGWSALAQPLPLPFGHADVLDPHVEAASLADYRWAFICSLNSARFAERGWSAAYLWNSSSASGACVARFQRHRGQCWFSTVETKEVQVSCIGPVPQLDGCQGLSRTYYLSATSRHINLMGTARALTQAFQFRHFPANQICREWSTCRVFYFSLMD
jgi:hypothetical protein